MTKHTEERTKTHACDCKTHGRTRACDCISRQAVLEQINCWIGSGEYRYTNATSYLTKRMQDISPVTPKPCDDVPSVEPERKSGRWIYRKNPNLGKCMQEVRECSACGRVFCDHIEPYKSFCGFCGAKMEVET